MRIGIDVRVLEQNEGGFERYLRLLLKGFEQIDQRNEYFLYADHEIKGLPSAKNFTYRFIERRFHSQVWVNLSLVRSAAADGIDVMHFPASSVWINRKKKTVVTLHDIGPVLYPEFKMASPSMLCYFKFLFHQIKTKSDIIVTVSRSSKEDIAQYLKIPDEKVKVVHSGIDPVFRLMNEKDVQRIRERFGLPQRFILFVGSFQVRKNLPGLMRAYNLFLSKYQLPHHMVIVGKTRQDMGSNYLKNKDLIALIENKERIHFIGYQKEEDLVGIYNAAELFVLVSFYEGFGFPYLESMACGTPVVAGNNSSGPEIVGDAGILVNPLNPEEIADSMASCLTNGQLRQSMIDKGLNRVKEYTPLSMAEETMRVYREVCE